MCLSVDFSGLLSSTTTFFFFILLLFQCLLTIEKAAAVGCGRSRPDITSTREGKVVGGSNALPGEFPFVVSIRKNGLHHCGGVILGQRWILTAAHCVQNQKNNKFIVRVGEHELNSKVDSSNPYSQELLVQKVFIHADYSPVGKAAAAAAATPTNSTTTKNSWSEVANNADIALLKTADDLHWNEYVWPVCPPSSSVSSSGSGSRPSPKSNELEAREGGGGGGEFQQPRLATVIGWGKRSEVRSDFSDRLQKATVAIVGSRECEQWFRLAGRQLAISERILCAGWREGGRDSCHGDSGSPLLVRGTDNGVDYYTVAGIVSTGIGCARPLMPGIYSNVSAYLSWINRTMLQFN